ncbi:GntR family transcriptional regulator [Actinopolymorpha sp. B9G3]|uniref:GntR family transcriptional regulator n=1 Tax=Actinopolymorpha sp. B9G3 TaxID=3158970 RepID=UPI0032D8B988
MPTEHKHERVARLLRESLGPPGSALPSEAELVEKFEVGRGTIRQALATLEYEGLITSSQGNRRTVRDGRRWEWPMSEWERAHSNDGDAWANTIRAQGGEPKNEMRITTIEAPAEVAKALQIPEGTPIQARYRVRSVDGIPHQLSESYFPPFVTDDNDLFWDPRDVGVQGGLLAATGHKQARWYDTITSRMPTADESQQLRMALGTPLLVHTRTGFDAEDRPVRYLVTRMAADQVEVSYNLEA